jgi:hypothetical protein
VLLLDWSRVVTDKKHYDVLIATPASSYKAAYVDSLIATTRVLNEYGISYHLLNKSGSFIPSTREQVASDSYGHDWSTNEIAGGKYTYKKIFWIDSDIEWEPDDFMRIYDSEMDVVSGVYMTHPNGTVAVNLTDPEGRPTKVNKSDFLLRWDPVEVGGVGFGFVAMKHGVFENMKRPWFKIREVYWEEIGFPVNMGEDYSWCEGAKEAGYKIWVDSLVKVKHHKEVIYVVE